MEKFVRDKLPAHVKRTFLHLLKIKGCSDNVYNALRDCQSISDFSQLLEDNSSQLTNEWSEKEIKTTRFFNKIKEGISNDDFSDPQIDFLIMHIDEYYQELMKQFIIKNYSDFVLEVLNYPKGLIPDNIDEESKLELVAENFRKFNWFQLKEKLEGQ